MADGGEEHRFRLAGLLGGLGHLLQRLLHFDARRDIHQHANRHVLVTVARMDKADLQIGIVMRQLVTQDIGAVDRT